MRNILRISPIILVVSFILPVPNVHAREKLRESLCGELWGKKLATFVADPVDRSGNAGESLGQIKKDIEDALSTRMNISFHIVPDGADADIAIECEIKEYSPAKEGGAEGAGGILGVFGGGDSSLAEALFTVTNLRTKKIMWQKKIRATAAAKDDSGLTPSETLNERLAEAFVRECFAKKKLRAAFPVRKEDPIGSY